MEQYKEAGDSCETACGSSAGERNDSSAQELCGV